MLHLLHLCEKGGDFRSSFEPRTESLSRLHFFLLSKIDVVLESVKPLAGHGAGGMRLFAKAGCRA